MTDLSKVFKFNNYGAGGMLDHQHTGGVRFLDKDISQNERSLYNNWWQEQIFQYGTEVEYFQTGYGLGTHDPIYGEEPSGTYMPPVRMMMALELNESAIVLNKFGLVGDDEITGYIAIDTFYTLMSAEEVLEPEPKSGDVFKLTEYGAMDRVGGRDGKIFEITDRVEQDISKINPLIGHYIWLIKAKRYNYSFEPGLDAEGASDQVYEESSTGLLPGFTQDPSLDKAYTDDINIESQNVFDYNKYSESNDDIYGGYN